MEIFSMEIPRAGLSPDAKFYFRVSRFYTDILKIQQFSEANRIDYALERPGLYSIRGIFSDDGSIEEIPSVHKYIPPESRDLDLSTGFPLLDKSIDRSRRLGNVEPFQAKYKGHKYDFIFFPANRQKLFVLCPSAIRRDTFPVPFFYRWQWAASGVYPGNVLVVSDPTFNIHPRMEAGWFVGTRENDATLDFCAIINRFVKVLKIPYRDIVFWGSSAGGFIAMQLAKYFPGACAVAVNAQTDIARFNGHQLLYETAFKGMTESEINLQYAERVTIGANIEKLSKNRVFLIQNIQDEHHYREHFLPLLQKITGDENPRLPDGLHALGDSPFTCWLYSHEDGHMPETKEMTATILERLG